MRDQRYKTGHTRAPLPEEPERMPALNLINFTLAGLLWMFIIFGVRIIGSL
jgi:hypothetical protein